MSSSVAERTAARNSVNRMNGLRPMINVRDCEELYCRSTVVTFDSQPKLSCSMWFYSTIDTIYDTYIHIFVYSDVFLYLYKRNVYICKHAPISQFSIISSFLRTILTGRLLLTERQLGKECKSCNIEYDIEK